MYHIGIDIGGTSIKMGIVDDAGAIRGMTAFPTRLSCDADAVCDDMVAQVEGLLRAEGLSMDEIEDVGIGCPGTTNPETGVVVYANNLDWVDYPIRDYLGGRIDKPIYIENDANVAVIAEHYAGNAQVAGDAVVITIGTGVGAGAIINSRLLHGYRYGAGEFGHMVIVHGGKPCNCGRRGCLEAYASVNALIDMTGEEMRENPDSLMWHISPKEVSGKTAFDAMKRGDAAAARVVERYIGYLALGITNLINLLHPEVICLGGGLSQEGDALMNPLRQKVYAEIYGGNGPATTRLLFCRLGNDAGVVGAALLGRFASN